ncbi:MAG: ABC transporter permease [Acidobacteriota bacterium]
MNDLKFALRQLRRNPGFTAVAVFSLALGIGANTAVFGLLSAVLLRPLPVQDARALRVLSWTAPPLRDTNFWYGRPSEMSGERMTAHVFAYPIYDRLREQVAGKAEIFGFADITSISPLTVVAAGQASTANGLMVSGNFFRALGLTPLFGQTLTEANDRPGAAPVTVISYAAWQQRFNGDPKVLGQTVALNNHTFEIIGVLPRDFQGLVAGSRCDYYLPFAAQPQMTPQCPLASDQVCWVQVMARLAPGVDEARIRSSLDIRFAQSVDSSIPENVENTAHVVLEDGRGGPLTPRLALTESLWPLLGLAGILLLINCVNLAGLLLARAVRRQHEMAVRVALGAGRARLIRQHLVESLLIALAGTAGGLMLARWGEIALARWLWPVDVTLDVSLDLRVFLFAVGLSIAATFLAALLPAWGSTRGKISALLGSRSGAGLYRMRWGRILVAAQMGLSLALMAGAGLFVQTLINLHRVDTGFQSSNLLVFKIDATGAGYPDRALVDFYERVRSSLAALPGADAVANSNYLLLSGNPVSSGEVRVNRGDGPAMSFRVQALHISDNFLSTFGIPLPQGRAFTALDVATQARVAIINRTLAGRLFPDEDPVGQRLPWTQEEFRIVGVCGDIKDSSLKKPAEPTVFYPYSWLPQHVPPPAVWSYYAVKTPGDPRSLIPAVRKVVAELNPTIPVTDIKTQAVQLEQSIARERCFASLALILALLTVLLSCMGLYSIMAYYVARRTNEIGLRMALGATTAHVCWTVLKSALFVVVAGIAAGVPVFLATARITRSYLFGIDPYDPGTLVISVVLLVAVAMLATWLPSRRAARIDPTEALRYE